MQERHTVYSVNIALNGKAEEVFPENENMIFEVWIKQTEQSLRGQKKNCACRP